MISPNEYDEKGRDTCRGFLSRREGTTELTGTERAGGWKVAERRSHLQADGILAIREEIPTDVLFLVSRERGTSNYLGEARRLLRTENSHAGH